jgi:hypothetical protein
MSGKVASGQSLGGHLSINCQVVITSLTTETVDHQTLTNFFTAKSSDDVCTVSGQ